MATARTTNDMMPTLCDGNRWPTGKPNPVTLVATVVARKSAVQPSSRFPVSRPNMTTNPEPIPTKLNNTCTKVNVDIVIPQTMLLSLQNQRDERVYSDRHHR